MTSTEEKLTICANSNKEICLQEFETKLEQAVSTSRGYLYKGELLQAWSILFLSMVDQRGKYRIAEDWSSRIFAEVIFFILGGLRFDTT